MFELYDLQKRTIFVFLCVAVLFFISYQWMDAPIVYFLRSHHVRTFPFIAQLRPYADLPSSILSTYIMYPALIYFVCRMCCGSLSLLEKKLFLLLLIVIVAYAVCCGDHIRTFLGRYWPETWFHHNPSLISTGSDAFHIHLKNTFVGSFPSGHALITSIVSTFVWHHWPKLKIIFFLYALFVMSMMVLEWFHYFGDVIVGAGLGYLFTYYGMYIHQKHTITYSLP